MKYSSASNGKNEVLEKYNFNSMNFEHIGHYQLLKIKLFWPSRAIFCFAEIRYEDSLLVIDSRKSWYAEIAALNDSKTVNSHVPESSE